MNETVPLIQVGLRHRGGLVSRPAAEIGREKTISTLRVILYAAAVFLLWTCDVLQAAGVDPLLPKTRDSYFVENNLVYSRYLHLRQDGSYQQINQDHTGSAEADRGTWEQTQGGIVLLHSTRRGLRFRALLSGPMSVVLDRPDVMAALPQLAKAIEQLLNTSEDAVFESQAARDLSVAPATVAVDRQAETVQRNELEALAAQIEDTIQTEQTHTYRLTPVRPAGGPLLLILQDAVYEPAMVAQVKERYHVLAGGSPPFYFAQTEVQPFANRVGRWRELTTEDQTPLP